MIIFTGSGSLASEFAKSYDCKIVSARSLSDDELRHIFVSATTVIHNAAVINTNTLSGYVKSNFCLTKRILDIVYNVNPTARFINISSMSFLATSETAMPADMMSDYAFSKYIAEEYCIRHPIKLLTSVRFSTIFYGDHTKDGLSKLGFDAVSRKKITVYNNGEALRDFIPIKMAAAYLYNLTQQVVANKKINVASGQPLPFSHFADIIVKKYPFIQIENINAKTNNVLHDFDITPMYPLGIIKFAIDEEFINYLANLNENISL